MAFAHLILCKLRAICAGFAMPIKDSQEELVWIAIEVGVHAQRVLTGFVGLSRVVTTLCGVGIVNSEARIRQLKRLRASGGLLPLFVLLGGQRAIRALNRRIYRRQVHVAAFLRRGRRTSRWFGSAEAHSRPQVLAYHRYMYLKLALNAMLTSRTVSCCRPAVS